MVSRFAGSGQMDTVTGNNRPNREHLLLAGYPGTLVYYYHIRPTQERAVPVNPTKRRKILVVHGVATGDDADLAIHRSGSRPSFIVIKTSIAPHKRDSNDWYRSSSMTRSARNSPECSRYINIRSSSDFPQDRLRTDRDSRCSLIDGREPKLGERK